MRLTTKGRYAVTAMLDVALNDSNSPVRIAEVSRRQGISQSYLEQLFASLKKNGLVNGRRGPGGGYQLGRKSENSILEVFAPQMLNFLFNCVAEASKIILNAR